jgi:hypothetical protein
MEYEAVCLRPEHQIAAGTERARGAYFCRWGDRDGRARENPFSLEAAMGSQRRDGARNGGQRTGGCAGYVQPARLRNLSGAAIIGAVENAELC